jgi:hypothetical protein
VNNQGTAASTGTDLHVANDNVSVASNNTNNNSDGDTIGSTINNVDTRNASLFAEDDEDDDDLEQPVFTTRPQRAHRNVSNIYKYPSCLSVLQKSSVYLYC